MKSATQIDNMHQNKGSKVYSGYFLTLKYKENICIHAKKNTNIKTEMHICLENLKTALKTFVNTDLMQKQTNKNELL